VWDVGGGEKGGVEGGWIEMVGMGERRGRVNEGSGQVGVVRGTA